MISEEENLRMAEIYWQNGANEDGRDPIVEILADGDIEILEIVKEINGHLHAIRDTWVEVMKRAGVK